MNLPRPLALPTGPTGESFVFHRSCRSPGNRFCFTWTLQPGKTGPGEHAHARETHFVRVVSGAATAWLDGVRHDFKAGDSFTIPPGVAHRFKNFGDVPMVAEAEMDGPGLEDFIVPWAVELHRRGGKMSPMLGAQMLVQLEAVQPNVPVGSTVWVVRILAPLARLLIRLGIKPLPPVLDWDKVPERDAA